MSKWEMVTLNDVCSLITDGTHQTPQYAEKGFMFLSSKNVTTGKIDWENIKYIPEGLHNQLYARIAPQIGDVLLAKNGTTGVAAVVDKDYVFDIYVSLALLRPKDLILSEYLLYAINNPITKRKFNKELKGIGVPNLHLKNIRDTTILLPPLETQKQIAKTLDTTAELLAMRKQQLAELDNLIKSTFYDMFGDPWTNEKGWETLTIGDLLTVLTDYHSNGSYEKLRDNVELLDEPNYALMIRTTDLENENYINNVKHITKEAYEYLVKSKVYGGDIIINKIGSAGKVYLMPYLNIPVSLAMNQFLLRFNEYCNVMYVYYFLNTEFSEKNILERVRGAVTKTITKDAIRSVPFILPPLPLQNQFANIVTKIEEQKALVKKAIDETQYLFDSLMSEYFE